MARTMEFETELTGSQTLTIPPEVARELPSDGRATVVVLVGTDPDDATWRQVAYERFLSDDSEEDAAYDKYR